MRRGFHFESPAECEMAARCTGRHQHLISGLYAHSYSTSLFACLSVDVTFQQVFDGENFDEVTPAQLCRQRRHNSVVRKVLCELQHSNQTSTPESLPVLCRQLRRQCLHNLLTVLRPFVSQHILAYAFADLPVIMSERVRLIRTRLGSAAGFADEIQFGN